MPSTFALTWVCIEIAMHCTLPGHTHVYSIAWFHCAVPSPPLPPWVTVGQRPNPGFKTVQKSLLTASPPQPQLVLHSLSAFNIELDSKLLHRPPNFAQSQIHTQGVSFFSVRFWQFFYLKLSMHDQHTFLVSKILLSQTLNHDSSCVNLCQNISWICI